MFTGNFPAHGLLAAIALPEPSFPSSNVVLAIWVTLAILAIVGSALASGIEIGCYSVNRVRLSLRLARTPRDVAAHRLRDELDKPDRLLGTLLISNNLVNALAATATTEIFARSTLGELEASLLNVIILAPLMFLFGEVLPKELFRVEADRLTYAFAAPLRYVRWMLTLTGLLPAVALLTRVVERAAGLKNEALGDARQRVAQLLKEGAGHGVLSESQVSLMDRAMLLRGLRVVDEMVPWAQVRALPADADRESALRVVAASGNKRLPLVDRTGRVVGVLRGLDLLLRPRETPLAMATPPARFRPDVGVREALTVLLERRGRIGIVEDDAGRPIGLVTARDLVEPLTGELADLS